MIKEHLLNISQNYSKYPDADADDVRKTICNAGTMNQQLIDIIQKCQQTPTLNAQKNPT